MTAWERGIKLILDYEGGYVNDPNDPGGETKYGICKASYPSEDIRNLTLERAQEIYKRDYWDRAMCDQLPEKLAIEVFDCAVNQGVVIAIRLLQVTLHQEVDGVLGPKTLGAAQRAGDIGAWLYLLQRAKRYMQTKKVEIYGNNWGTRLIQMAESLFLDQDKASW
jgi:lysozyme family protein